MNAERNLNFDVMRLLGVLLIVIAHASPPEWLFQLRNFGTPLLIVASALTYSVIYANKAMDVSAFYKKRLSRLIIPAWIFLSFFFAAFMAASRLLDFPYPFSLHEIIFSFNFMSGIGFVWILKVYIILALITPITLELNKRISSNKLYFFLLATVYLAYEACVYVAAFYLSGGIEKLFNLVIFVAASYSILYLYGYRLIRLKTRDVVIASTASLLIFLMLMGYKFHQNGSFIETQGFKYPPTLYYLSYAFFALNAVYLMCIRLKLDNSKWTPTIVWLSSKSLWIYLWHIMGYYIWEFTMVKPEGDFVLSLAKTVFLLAFGIVFTLLQSRLIAKLPKNFPFQRQIVSWML